MEPQEGRTASPLCTRPHGLRKTTLRTVGLNAEKTIGIESKGGSFLLTFPLIGLYRLGHRGELTALLNPDHSRLAEQTAAVADDEHVHGPTIPSSMAGDEPKFMSVRRDMKDTQGGGGL